MLKISLEKIRQSHLTKKSSVTHSLRCDRLIYDVSKSMLNSDGKRFSSGNKSIIKRGSGYLEGDCEALPTGDSTFSALY